ncbi:MAG: hypothetical protein P9M13_00835 [Candidatus Ancaeobacter aquaticus]|nr:hypothetical protein [Candidatus Ancaeobacter aquaticus]
MNNNAILKTKIRVINLAKYLMCVFQEESINSVVSLSVDGPYRKFVKREVFLVLLFLVLSFIYVSPNFENINNYSCGDGESYQTINAVINKTILEHKQIPLWNPYSGGGNVMLAHPESPFLSPLYLPVLIFGTVIGIKIQIVLYYFIGLCGMYALCRYLNFKVLPAFLSAIIFAFNSYLSNHLNLGYFPWMTIVWLPWAFLFYLKSFVNRKNIVWCAIVLSLLLFEGGVHNLTMICSFLIAYSVFESIRSKTFKPIIILVFIAGVSVLISGIKLVPMLQFMDDYPRRASHMVLPYVPYWTLLISLLDRGFYGKWYHLPSPNFVGQEFLAYIGIIPLLILIIGAVKSYKKYWPLILTLIVFVFISFGRGAWFDLWDLIKHLPVYNNQFITVRNVIIIVFIGALIIGYYLSKFEYSRLKNVLLGLVVLFVLADLTSHGWYYIRCFPNKLKEVAAEGNFVQEKTEKLLPTFLKGHGNLLFWRPARIDLAAKSIVDEGYKGEVYFSGQIGKASIEKFTPNKICINYDIAIGDILILNQNYYKGWHAYGDSPLKVFSYNGLIGITVPKGIGSITLTYFPYSFILGIIVSLIGIGISIIILHKKRI